MKNIRANSYIESSAAYVEEGWAVTNDFFLGHEGIIYDLKEEKLVEKDKKPFSEEFMESMMGVKKRYFCPKDLHVHNLIYESAKMALSKREINKNHIDSIITTGVTSQYNFHTFPSHASMIQLNTDLRNVKWAMDIATHQKSYETAQTILNALNKQRGGVYIAVFAKTKGDLIVNPRFNTPLYGPPSGYIILLPNGSIIHSDKSTGLDDPKGLEDKVWEATSGNVEDYYQNIGLTLKDSFEKHGLDPTSIMGIALINQTQKNSPNIPTNSSLQKKLLGINRINVCCDIAMACAGTQGAFAIADGMMPKLEKTKMVFVNSAETLEKITDIYDEMGNIRRGPMDANNPLFGTMSNSFLISHSPDGRGFIYFNGHSDPFEGKHRYIFKDELGYLRMPKGGEVLKKATRDMTKSIEEMMNFLEINGIKRFLKDFIHLTHNANIRIVNGVGSRLEKANIPGQIPININKISNVSSASCAKLIVDYIPFEANDVAFPTVAFGSGLAETLALYCNLALDEINP